MESPDFNGALGMFLESRDEFDLWFNERLANPTRGRPEQPTRDSASGAAFDRRGLNGAKG